MDLLHWQPVLPLWHTHYDDVSQSMVSYICYSGYLYDVIHLVIFPPTSPYEIIDCYIFLLLCLSCIILQPYAGLWVFSWTPWGLRTSCSLAWKAPTHPDHLLPRLAPSGHEVSAKMSPPWRSLLTTKLKAALLPRNRSYHVTQFYFYQSTYPDVFTDLSLSSLKCKVPESRDLACLVEHHIQHLE